MSTVPETIRRLRKKLALSPEEMAERIQMNVPSYYDLESDPEEWEEAAELRQLLELSRILQTPLLDLLGESSGEVPDPCSFPDLAEIIRRGIAEGRLQEDRIGWDLSEFWEEPMIAMEYPVLFLRIVGEDVGFDWRRPILYYQSAELDATAPNGRPAPPRASSNLNKDCHR